MQDEDGHSALAPSSPFDPAKEDDTSLQSPIHSDYVYNDIAGDADNSDIDMENESASENRCNEQDHVRVDPDSVSVTREYHPYINGRPCDKNGVYLPDGTPPPPCPAPETDNWFPYYDRVAFETAEFLYNREQMSAGNIDTILQLWAASLLQHHDDLPFANCEDLYNTIDSTLLSDVKWESFNLQYEGQRPERDVPSWMTAKYEVYFWNPSEVFHDQMANADFDSEIDYAPLREFVDGQRHLKNFMSGDWAWRQADLIAQDPNTHGVAFVPVILGSDKITVSVATGQTEYYPLYGSIGGVHNNVHRAHRNAVTLLGFLAIPKTDKEFSEDAMFRKFHRQLFHSSLSRILQPLKPGMMTPEIMLCADGHYRHVVYGLGPYIADYPEQVLLACIVSGWCAKFKQWTGDDSKALMKVYLPAIAEYVPEDMVWAIQAFLDFCYIAQRNVHTEQTLDALQDALDRFHYYRKIFETCGVQPDGISLPQQHSLCHYRFSIWEFASPNGLCSSITESKHIKARIDKLAAAYVDFTKRGMLKGSWLSNAFCKIYADPTETEDINIGADCHVSKPLGPDEQQDDDGSVPGPTVLVYVDLAATVQQRHPRGFAELAHQINQPELPELIRRFLYDQLNPNNPRSASDMDKIVLYAKKVGYTPNFVGLLQHVMRTNPEKGAEFSAQFVNDDSGPLMDVEWVVDIFMSQNMIQPAASFLLDALKENKPEQAHLQTHLLEMNLIHAPQVVDAILGNEMFTHYDRPRIANLCEKAGLMQRVRRLSWRLIALAHILVCRLSSTTRTWGTSSVIVHANVFQIDWLVSYFSRLTTEQSLACMGEILRINIRQNLQVVVQITTKYSDILGPVKLIELFEKFKSFEDLYYYLGSIVNLSQDSEVHFKYIQAATRTGQIREVERICREGNYYNPEKVKNFLKEAKLSDQLPLIIICDQFDFVYDLVLYLYQNGLTSFIEVYVQRVNSVRTPQVIGGLLDVDCDETTVKSLLASVPGNFPINELVNEVETMNRLKLILPWLEAHMQAGSQDPAVYNALAKIYIESNNNPETFLKENNLYEPLVISKFFPHLLVPMLATAEHPVHNIAKVSFGMGTNELYDRAQPSYQPATLSHIHNALSASASLNTVEIGAGTGIFTRALLAHPDWSHSVNQLHAIELSEGMRDVFTNFVHDPRVSITKGTFDSTGVNDGWADHVIIAQDNMHRHQLMDQIIATALPESTDPDDVSVTGKAFLMADLPIELIELLEKLILEPSPFSDNRNLQNLMVLTAIHADKGKVVGYIDKLKNYDIAEIAKIVTDHGLYEEAFLIYKKYEQHAMAINVLIEHIVFLDRGTEYAIKVNRPKVWSRLVKAQLDGLRIKDAIDSYIKAENSSNYTEVIEIASHAGKTTSPSTSKWRNSLVSFSCTSVEGISINFLPFWKLASMGIFTELSAFYGKYRPEKFMEHLKLFVSRINIPKVIKAAEQAHLWPELVFL
ncbi:hypothetical protein SCP_1102880 [Sparassis crispa]|uniref:Methyltransferase type 12 domain-containing protein n=1 Tax=Sparassis crispa TaxID=139825 RepID=A0A401GZM0_9APHY|nr:hypothetical protein SCP_1102880 [Sparassis crispa]GBE87611.1 hypothetical protein SCP_1102880 [Sparassis crispa]